MIHDCPTDLSASGVRVRFCVNSRHGETQTGSSGFSCWVKCFSDVTPDPKICHFISLTSPQPVRTGDVCGLQFRFNVTELNQC